MNKEVHLFIIWEYGRLQQNRIVADIDKNFNILDIIEMKWSNEKFSENLTRFYGQNLPRNSSKEISTGKGEFLIIVVEDTSPIYGYRKTSKGSLYINVNMFDSKDLYRNWCKGNKIHGTNTVKETTHDLMLLLDQNIQDFLDTHSKNWDGIIKTKIKDLFGSNGWKSEQELFYALNSTIDYSLIFDSQRCITYSLNDVNSIVANDYYNLQSIVNKSYCEINGKVKLNLNINGRSQKITVGLTNNNKYNITLDEFVLAKRKFDGMKWFVVLDELVTNLSNNSHIEKVEYIKKIAFKEGCNSRMLNLKTTQYDVCNPKTINYQLSLHSKIIVRLKSVMKRLKILPSKIKSRIMYTLRKQIYNMWWNITYKNKFVKEIKDTFKLNSVSPILKSKWIRGSKFFEAVMSYNGKKLFIKSSKYIYLIERESMWDKYFEIHNIKINKPKILGMVTTSINHNCLLMEYINAPTLNELIIDKSLDPLLKKRIILQLLDILDSLQKNRLIHRDIRPDNILVSFIDDNIKLYLIDFAYAIKEGEAFKGFGSTEREKNLLFGLGGSLSPKPLFWDDAYSIFLICKMIEPEFKFKYPTLWLEINKRIGKVTYKINEGYYDK